MIERVIKAAEELDLQGEIDVLGAGYFEILFTTQGSIPRVKMRIQVELDARIYREEQTFSRDMELAIDPDGIIKQTIGFAIERLRNVTPDKPVTVRAT